MKRTTIMLKALAVIVMSFFFSSSLLPQGDVVRSSSLVPQDSNNCIDLEFEQDGVLPSSQGFTYTDFANPTGIPEGAAFSVSGGVLHINTLGTGAVAGYLLPNAFNPNQDFTLEFRMKVFPGTGPFGIDFEVSDDVTDKDFEFGFVPDGILLPPPPAARPFSPFNTADDFHTYKVFSPGGTQIYQLFIDGMLVVSGTVSDGDPGPQRFVFGDLTGGSDGRADIDFIRYCQPPPTCVAPPSGMVSWWPGDGNANDIKEGNHGGLQNGATFAPGLVGQAFSFDGVDDFVVVPNTPALNPNSITVDAWIRPDSVGGFRRIVSKGQALVDLFIGPEAQLRCIVNPASLPFSCCGIDVPTAGVTVTAGVWSHVACTWDAPTGQGKVYLNGQQVGGTLDLADNNPLRSTVGDLFIGRAWFDHVSFFDGLIDEVEIFDRALTATEIQSLFNAGQAGKCKDGDSDGVPDSQDDCPNSILSPTVVIDGCDSTVPNTVFPNGCTISDRIQQCAAGTQNHGQFVSCVAHLTNDLKRAGVITGQQKGAIQSCAAQAHIP